MYNCTASGQIWLLVYVCLSCALLYKFIFILLACYYMYVRLELVGIRPCVEYNTTTLLLYIAQLLAGRTFVQVYTTGLCVVYALLCSVNYLFVHVASFFWRILRFYNFFNVQIFLFENQENTGEKSILFSSKNSFEDNLKLFKINNIRF